jgi:NAD(P)-dependent dehydrogenase (short-subunit alcohol dehydrogenase family)
VENVSEAGGLLRPGLLAGVSVLVAGAPEPAPASGLVGLVGAAGELGATVSEACTELGAAVRTCAPGLTEEAIVDEMLTAALAEIDPIDLLVVDGAGLFAQRRSHTAGELSSGDEAVRGCLDAAWNVTRAVVNLAFLPSATGGRIIYVAPAPGAGEFAGAARAGLENLSRTLSTEWARHGITVVTIAPGDMTTAGGVAALCAYLASPAGAYFSGCLLDLRGPEDKEQSR